MGSPISVADLVMEDIEDRALSTFPSSPCFWKRYVDDTCCAIPINQLQHFHDHLNKIKPSIKITIEQEQNGELPFLDTLVKPHPDGLPLLLCLP